MAGSRPSRQMPDLPDSLSEPQRALLADIVDALSAVPGVLAVALGGSHVRGFATPESDVDLGIYYRRQQPFDISALRGAASTLARGQGSALTPLWEWGPWVNGGGWLRIAEQSVDWIYREFEQLEEVLVDAMAGDFSLHYGQQPPAGFHSYTLLGELGVCLPLWDPEGRLAALTEQVRSYPAALADQVIASGLRQVDFALMFARAGAERADVPYTVRCLSRIVTYLDQVVFALNRAWFINDKTVSREIAGFERVPAGYGNTLSRVLGAPGLDAASLALSVERVDELYEHVLEFAPGVYTRIFAAGKPEA